MNTVVKMHTELYWSESSYISVTCFKLRVGFGGRGYVFHTHQKKIGSSSLLKVGDGVDKRSRSPALFHPDLVCLTMLSKRISQNGVAAVGGR